MYNPFMQNVIKNIRHWLQGNPKGVLVVTGPTASGKTGVSIQIAEGVDGEIINADSRQIYKDLSITTAVPTEEEKKGIPHHLFEYISPEKTYNVSEWRDDALQKIEEIRSRKKIPILCGGTGLWINALTKNFTLGVAPNERFRAEMNTKSSAELFSLLQKKDPKAAEVLGENNKKYIIRALEICEEKGSKTEHSLMNESQYSFYFLGTTWRRDVLYDRINNRTELMFEDGFLEEVQAFLKKYPAAPKNDSAFIAHGVPEAIEYFSGEKTLDELKEKMKQNTRNYAKRQLTWWRKDSRVQFIDMETGAQVDIADKRY